MKHFFTAMITLLSASATSTLMASTLVLPATMDAGSVQAKLKNLLFSKLEAEGEITGEYQANLTGSYGEVTLEDEKSKLVCREFSAGILAVQQFTCTLEINDGQDLEVSSAELERTMDAASVQALVKGLLFSELEKTGPVTNQYEAKLLGSYRKVTLVDSGAQLTCTEGSIGMLTVQAFGCKITLK